MKGLWLLSFSVFKQGKKPLIKRLLVNASQNFSSDIFFTKSSSNEMNYFNFLNQLVS